MKWDVPRAPRRCVLSEGPPLAPHPQPVDVMVYGLWFMVYGLWFRVWGLGFRVWGLGLRVWG